MITLDTKLNAALNTQVANWSLLYTKLHRYHWYVTGPHFLHYMKNLKSYIMRQLR